MPDLASELRNALATADKAQRLLVVIGSGVSIGATRGHPASPAASWKGLLELASERCVELNLRTKGWLNAKKRDLRSGDLDTYLAVASEIEDRLGAPGNGAFLAFLERSVGQLAPSADRTTIQALAALGVPLATTNYDGLLEEVTGLRCVTWRQPAMVERILRGDDTAILHLHGHWQEPESVILGQRSYDRVLNDSHAQATLRRIMASRTVLFVGCGEGLEDPDFGLLRRWAEQTLKASLYNHYRLLLAKEVKKAPGRVPDDRIYLISYGKNHSDLGPFLHGLIPGATHPPPVTPVSDPSTSATPGTRSAGSPASPLTASAEIVSATPAPTPGPALLIAQPPLPLPVAPQRWFGRDALAGELIQVLLRQPPPPLALRGHPGQGKTALAIWLLHSPQIAQKFGPRRYFVRCEPHRSRADLGVALATSLGLAVGQHAEALALAELERGPAILVLDNLETPWEHDRQSVEELLLRLAALSTACGLALVVTVRGVERPAGIAWNATPQVPRLTRDDSQKLFLHIAGAHLQTDRRLNELLSAADDLPLAVELLAHQAEDQPDLEDLWQRWEAGHTLILQRGGGGSRETNLEVSIDLSLKSPRQTDASRRMLGVLSRLPVGMLRSDLRSVFSAFGTEGLNVLHKIGLAQDENERWRLLNPVREYVREHHAALLSFEDQRKLVGFYQNLAAQEGQRIFGTFGAQAKNRLTEEFPNIVQSIWEFALQKPAASVALWSGDPRLVFQTFQRLNAFLYSTELEVDSLIGSLLQDARTRNLKGNAAECAFLLGRRLYLRGEQNTAEVMLVEAYELFVQSNQLLSQAHCLHALAQLALARGDQEKAKRGFTDTRERYMKLGNSLGQASCILGLAELAQGCGEMEQAEVGFKKARVLFGKLDDLQGQAVCIRCLAELAQVRGEMEQAQAGFEDAYGRYGKLGNPLGQAHCIVALNKLAAVRGEMKKAQAGFKEAHELYGRLGNPRGQADCIQSLAELARMRGEMEQARAGFEEAYGHYGNTGNPHGQASCIQNLAKLAQVRGEMEQAQAGFEEAYERYKKVSSPLGQAGCIQSLARLAQVRGHMGKAQAGFEAACELYGKVGNPLGQALCLYGLAELALGSGDIDKAQRGFEQTHELYRKVSDQLGMASCIHGLAQVAQARGEMERAQRGFEEAYRCNGKVGHLLGQAACIHDLAHLALVRGRLERAQRAFEEADQCYGKAGNMLGQTDCRYGLAVLAHEQGDMQKALHGLEGAREHYAKLDNPLGQAHCIYSLARLAQLRGDLKEAQRGFEEAYDRYGKVGNMLGQANCSYGLAELAQIRGDLEMAQRGFEEARERHAKLSNPLGLANCSYGLAELAQIQGDLKKAQRGFEEAQERRTELDDPLGMAHCYAGLAVLAQRRGDTGEAKQLFATAEREYQERGCLWDLWRCRLGLADLSRVTGDLDAADAQYIAAIAFFASLAVRDRLREAEGRVGLALLARQRGQILAAIDQYQQALALYTYCGASPKITACKNELLALESLP